MPWTPAAYVTAAYPALALLARSEESVSVAALPTTWLETARTQTSAPVSYQV